MSVQRPDLRNIRKIVGPFTVMNANPPTPGLGGTLDRGLVGRLEDGTLVIIGEIWAACPTLDGGRVSVDTDELTQRIIHALNRVEP